MIRHIDIRHTIPKYIIIKHVLTKRVDEQDTATYFYVNAY